MAWNNPLANQLENTIEELGVYLQGKGLAVHEIARTQEVCRDFCNFLGKNIYEAGDRQFVIYQQLHATTYEDEQAYAVMMGNIKDFCHAEKMRDEYAESTHLAPDNNKPNSIGSLANAELKKMFACQEATPAPSVNRKKTSKSLSEDDMISQNSSETGAYSAPLFVENQFKQAELADKKGSEDNAQLCAENAKLSASLAMMFSEAEKAAAPVSAPVKSSSMKEFASKKRKEKTNSYQASSTDGDDKDDQNKDTSSEFDAFAGIQTTSPDEPYIADVAPNKDENLVRSVDGVQYNFSQKNIRKMRNFEKQKRQNDIKQGGNNPIDKSLLTGFQPYLFDSQYLIDMPLPDPNQMKKLGHDIVVQYFIPLAPVIVLVIIGILGIAIEVYPLALSLVLALLVVVLIKSDIMPANQLTPLSTLTAYLNAKNGRCYGMARTLIAQPKDKKTDDELSFPQLWAPEPKFVDAMKNRLHEIEPPEIRTVAGSEAKNQILFISIDGDNYWLLPMVRLKNNKWYITDPAMTVHTVSKKS